MRFSKLRPRAHGAQTVLIIVLWMLLYQKAWAVTGVSPSELQAAANVLTPSGDLFSALPGYSNFYLEKTSVLSGGISALYEAYLSEDPWLTDELPRLQLTIFSYSSQEASRQELETLASQASSQGKTVLAQNSTDLFYQSDGGSSVDSFGIIEAEYKSYHYLHSNGNLLFQASLFRTNGEFNEVNVKTYAASIEDSQSVETILMEAIESAKVMLGALFPPTDADYNLNSESYSVSLSEPYTLPNHGTISLNMYISEPKGALGTILDSAGLGEASAGDVYLYLNSDGRLFAGIYAPDFDADCSQEAGWYRIESTSPLSSYEWNQIILHFGVGGFGIELNGKEEAICTVSQARSSKTLYLGDYPEDTLNESMIGYVSTFLADASLTDSGRIWDEVLSEQLFLDLPNTDSDVRIFEFLKEEGIFIGSDGMLYPDQTLNRAEMVKILLKTFGIEETEEESELPFWDVPADAWYRKYLISGYEVGMIEGHEDGSFLPGHPINRAEFFTMLARLDGENEAGYKREFLDVEEEDWFIQGAVYAASRSLITTLFFSADQILTRREAAQILYQLLK